MKFHCPSCKAKYQIADEKVVGRTVKMKCRQCGYVIEINESLIADATLQEGGADAPRDLRSPEPKLPTPPTTPMAGQRVAPPKPGRLSGESTAIANRDKPGNAIAAVSVPRPMASTTGVSRSRAATELHPTLGEGGVSRATFTQPLARQSVSSRIAAPRPRSSQLEHSAVARPPTSLQVGEKKQGLTTGDSVSLRERSRSTPLAEKTASDEVPRPGSVIEPSGSVGVSVESDTDERPGDTTDGTLLKRSRNTSPKRSSLVGTSVTTVEQPSCALIEHPLAGDEWYVSIDERPVGPIRLTEIRDRAGKGEILPECLVWRDGLEDWRPLSAFPELVAVVEEGLASARSKPTSSSPEKLSSQEATEKVVALGATRVVVANDRLRAVSTTPSAAVQQQPIIRAQDEASLEVAGISRQKIPLSAWIAVLMALVFGVTLGVVFIKPEPPKPIIKYVEVPMKSSQGRNSPATTGPEQVAVVAAASEASIGSMESQPTSNASSRRPPSNNGNNVTSEVAAVTGTDVSQGLKGLSGLRGLAPQSGPQTAGATVSGGPSQLDSATLSKTVSRYTPSVKRSCWQPALDMRTPDAPTTARVTATITVGASGRVQNVTTLGDPKGYRGLASCIQIRVKNWEFPPAGGETTFNVPFVFAAQ